MISIWRKHQEAAGVFVLRNMNIDKNIFTNYYIAYNVGRMELGA